jgi:hypothetical protein
MCIDPERVRGVLGGSRVARGPRLRRVTRSALPAAYTLLEMAMAYAVQRLEIGDVVLIDLDEEATEVEAKVIRPIERTETTVRAWLRVEGREDFIREWPVGEQVTVVRGP